MQKKQFVRRCLPALIAALGAVAGNAEALTISRLTPPSNPVVAGASTLARFLPGQRFDLQATVRPDGNQVITSVEFFVDGASVGVVNNVATPNAATCATDKAVTGNKGMMPATTLTTATAPAVPVAPCSVAASLRAYSNAVPGVHTLTATATQDNGSTTTATGNFEVIGITANNGRPAKNIIIMLGDGMGASHRTAARIMAKGYAAGKAQGKLAMDTFPFTGMVMTSSLNSIVTDSAPGMSSYVSGNKNQNSQEGVFPDDTNDSFDNPRIEYLSEYLHRTKHTNLGIVTTADVFDATPAANAVHTADRGKGTGIVDQFLDDRNLTGLTVLMGGGRKWFIPKNSAAAPANPANSNNGSVRATSSDYALTADIVTGWGAAPGALDANRDLIADFTTAGFAYASNKTDMVAAGVPDKLLGLFSYSNMNVAFDKINGRRGTSTIVNDYGFPDQPMLDEMTDTALQVLNKNNANGFVLMVEGASIDKQAHLMDTDRWILETIEFDKAIQKAKDFATANPDTIVIVTADHECSGAAIIGASLGTAANQGNVGTYDAAKFPAYDNTSKGDGYPLTTDVPGKVLIGYGANADRFETWLSNAQPSQDSQQPFVKESPLKDYTCGANSNAGSQCAAVASTNVRNATTGYLVTGQVSGDQAVHTATDIPLSAFGRGASLFTGVFDNTDVFFKLGQIAIGGAK
jgi:alkaline phosphatase